MLGEGITIHKIDTVLSFGAPFQLFTYRSGYFAMNAALEAAQLAIDFGLSGPEATGLNISDFTIFVPTDEAFESIGSVLESADQATLQEVLKYHIIPNNVIFSTALGNVTVKSLQGADLVFTVLDDGSAWVNGAKIVYANTILFNGVAHVIDGLVSPFPLSPLYTLTSLSSVLSPLAPFDRASLDPSAPASDRVAFDGATSVSELPFASASLAFGGDLMTFTTTPELLKTVAAVATPTSGVDATTTGSPMETYTGAAMAMLPGAGMAVAGAMGVAAALV
jgi:hypothetical protein